MPELISSFFHSKDIVASNLDMQKVKIKNL